MLVAPHHQRAHPAQQASAFAGSLSHGTIAGLSASARFDSLSVTLWADADAADAAGALAGVFDVARGMGEHAPQHVMIATTRDFPAIGPQSGTVRILHCPFPRFRPDEDVRELQYRVGGLLNFDAIVVDSQRAREACLDIVARIGAPPVEIDVLPTPMLATIGRQNLVVVSGACNTGLLPVLIETIAARAGAGWRLVLLGDGAADAGPLADARDRLGVAAPTDLVLDASSAQLRALMARARVFVAMERATTDDALAAALASDCTPLLPAGSPTARFCAQNGHGVVYRDAPDMQSALARLLAAAPAASGPPGDAFWETLLRRVLPPRQTVATARARARPAALVVTGMHRSGTSMVTRLLSLAGAALPNNLMPPAQDNPAGFWEDFEITRWNELLLVFSGSSWNDARITLDPPAPATPQEVAQAAALLRTEFPPNRPIALKDPRITLLPALWRAAIDRAGYDAHFVVPIREPLAVATSLARRDDLPMKHGLLLWAKYAILAERGTRSAPRVFLAYDDVMTDPAGALARVQDELAVGLPRRERGAREAVGMIRSDLERSRPPADLLHAVPPEFASLHQMLLHAARGATFSAEQADALEHAAQRRAAAWMC